MPGAVAGREVRLPYARPQIMAIVDTEEEFDWHGPFDRARTGVEHMRRIGELQAVFARHGVRPVYGVGTPIATQPVAIEALRPLFADGSALVGAHLHPWVTEPFEEEVGPRNSYPGNLPRALEAAKLATLTQQIEAAWGIRPVIYKAGRYGAGPNTFAILAEQHYKIDISPMPPFDYRLKGGPDYSRRGNAPRWEGSVLSIPNTGAYVGALARPGREWIGDAALTPWATRLKLPGVLSRLGLFSRIALTPEGYTLDEMRALARAQVAAGQVLFMLALHSPSVMPGCTPYVRSEADQARLLDKLDRFLAWFRSEYAAEPNDPLRVLEAVSARPAAPRARVAVKVEAITDADLPEVAAYWRSNLNPAIDEPTWIEAFRRGWMPDTPNHGFKLIAEGRLVGTLGAIYSRQTIAGEAVDFCNLTSLVVEDAFRARSMDLLSALISQKQFRFTNFTPTPAVAKMLQLMKFRELRSGERLLVTAPVLPAMLRLEALEGDAIGPRVTGEAARLWLDHRGLPGLHCLAVGRDADWCLVFWRRSVIKALPGARILGISDVGRFLAWRRAIAGQLLLKHGVAGMRIAEHLLPAAAKIGIHRPIPTKRLYRGPDMAEEDVRFLYSELVALPI